MSFPYRNVLMVGATSGIGAGLADRLIHEGCKVIAVGRRQDRLDDFVRTHGSDMASAVKFDINDREKIKDFVRDVAKRYPDLDCIWLNAGTQNPLKLAEPADFDLSAFHSEVATNFTSVVDITVNFLPFLMHKPGETSIIFTGSHLGIIPAPFVPAYSASKAALGSFIFSLRDQLRDSRVKVIEVSPPVVQTELHDYMGSEKGRQLGMPLPAFVEEVWKGLALGNDQVYLGAPAGTSVEAFNDIVEKRRTAFENLVKFMRGGN